MISLHVLNIRQLWAVPPTSHFSFSDCLIFILMFFTWRGKTAVFHTIKRLLKSQKNIWFCAAEFWDVLASFYSCKSAPYSSGLSGDPWQSSPVASILETGELLGFFLFYFFQLTVIVLFVSFVSQYKRSKCFKAFCTLPGINSGGGVLQPLFIYYLKNKKMKNELI